MNKNNRKTILTGIRPSGYLHLGHYVGAVQNWVKLQHEYDQYVMLADVQALTDNFENPKKITESTYEVTQDLLSSGIDPNQTTLLIQSQIPEIAELTVYFMNLVTLARLERNPTVKTEIQQKGYDDSIPVGFFCYPISQAADITVFRADMVPAGDDQNPMIEQSNEIVRRFNRIYNTDCLKECTNYLSHASRLVGIDGKAKASKSLNNAIYLCDSAEEIKQKVFQMFTDPDHIRVSDPGKVEGNAVFVYLDAFHPDKAEVEDLKQRYQKGGLGDTTIKGILNTTLQNLLTPIREKRESLKHDYICDVLREGTLKARRVAQETMSMVREAMGINYW